MNETTRHSIVTLPFTLKELQSNNQNKTAYNTFVGVFIYQFNILNYQQKKNLLLSNNIHSPSSYQQHEDDPDIFDIPLCSGIDKSRLASKYWRRLSDELKSSWKERAILANNLPIIGQFEAIPPQITNEEILKAINIEYVKFVKLFNRAVRDKGRFIESMLFKSFGKEKIRIRSKIFRSLHLNHLLKLTFFGLNFSLIYSNEIVQRSKKCCIVHIHSKKRMQEIFEMNGVCAFFTEGKEDEAKLYGCAGRAILKCKRGKEGTAYVMDEGDGVFYLQLENGKDVEVPIPLFKSEIGRWDFSRCNSDDNEYRIIEYDPVRIKVYDMGNMHFLFHRMCIGKENEKLIPI